MLFLLFRHEVDNKGLVEDGKELLHEGLVILMGQVGLQPLLVLEGDDETVGVSLGEVFGAHVGSPLVVRDGADLGGKSSEGLFDGCDLVPGGIVLELEADDVAVGARLFLVMIGKGLRAHECKGKREDQKDDFHYHWRVPEGLSGVNEGL